MEEDATGERAVFADDGPAPPRGGIEPVSALPAELDRVWTTVVGRTNIHPTLDGDEPEAALTVAVELDVGRADQIERVGVPDLHLDDSPTSDGRGAHGTLTEAGGGEVTADRVL